MRTVAIVSSRVLLGLAVIAAGLLAAAPTSAHTPAASTECAGGLPYVTTTLTQYGAGANVRIRVDGDTILSHDFIGDYSTTLRIGSGYVGHDVQVRVTATDDPTGELDYSKTFDLYAPPCKERIASYHPKAWFNGPACDPMYRAVLDNRDSTAPVTFKWRRIDDNRVKVTERTVPAGQLVRTVWRHVDGETTQWVRARGQVLAIITSAPAGDYRCPW